MVGRAHSSTDLPGSLYQTLLIEHDAIVEKATAWLCATTVICSMIQSAWCQAQIPSGDSTPPRPQRFAPRCIRKASWPTSSQRSSKVSSSGKHADRSLSTLSFGNNAPSAVSNPPMPRPDDTMLLFDFSDPAVVRDWAPIDDRVMGGVSRSKLRRDEAGYAVFEGIVSLERGGGFASVRSSPAARGLPSAAACIIELRGDNKQFKISLLTSDDFDSMNYQASFTPSGIDWQTLRLPLATFRASFRGREIPGAPTLDPARIRQVGFLIADRQAGPFALEIKWISLA